MYVFERTSTRKRGQGIDSVWYIAYCNATFAPEIHLIHTYSTVPGKEKGGLRTITWRLDVGSSIQPVAKLSRLIRSDEKTTLLADGADPYETSKM